MKSISKTSFLNNDILFVPFYPFIYLYISKIILNTMETKVNNKNVRKKYLIKFSDLRAMHVAQLLFVLLKKKLKRKPKNGT